MEVKPDPSVEEQTSSTPARRGSVHIRARVVMMACLSVYAHMAIEP